MSSIWHSSNSFSLDFWIRKSIVVFLLDAIDKRFKHQTLMFLVKIISYKQISKLTTFSPILLFMSFVSIIFEKIKKKNLYFLRFFYKVTVVIIWDMSSLCYLIKPYNLYWWYDKSFVTYLYLKGDDHSPNLQWKENLWLKESIAYWKKTLSMKVVDLLKGASKKHFWIHIVNL